MSCMGTALDVCCSIGCAMTAFKFVWYNLYIPLLEENSGEGEGKMNVLLPTARETSSTGQAGQRRGKRREAGTAVGKIELSKDRPPSSNQKAHKASRV